MVNERKDVRVQRYMDGCGDIINGELREKRRKGRVMKISEKGVRLMLEFLKNLFDTFGFYGILS